ncbi:MAG TPA: hypothetical protein VG713_22160, partial [Pirellulales bacterium]|nr:hypothetical protein [Pirellulales bacterium]
EVPVLVLDLDEQEANKLLAILDPLGAMAGTDERLLGDLLRDIDTHNEALRKTLDALAERAGIIDDQALEAREGIEIDGLCQVVAECADESAQRSLYERLVADGYKCRLLTL